MGDSSHVQKPKTPMPMIAILSQKSIISQGKIPVPAMFLRKHG